MMRLSLMKIQLLVEAAQEVGATLLAMTLAPGVE